MVEMILPEETLERLNLYQELLLKWQAKINLISTNTVKDSWERHFEDSLQILPLIPDDTKILYDLGSGAGFPGLVLAIARPNLAVTLIESDSKKCAFLQTVSRETGVRVTVHNGRIEQAVLTLPSPDIITARALSNLEELLGLCAPWLEQSCDITAIFPKGVQFKNEIQAAKEAGWAFHVEPTQSKTDKNGKILCLSDIYKTPL